MSTSATRRKAALFFDEIRFLFDMGVLSLRYTKRKRERRSGKRKRNCTDVFRPDRKLACGWDPQKKCSFRCDRFGWNLYRMSQNERAKDLSPSVGSGATRWMRGVANFVRCFSKQSFFSLFSLTVFIEGVRFEKLRGEEVAFDEEDSSLLSIHTSSQSLANSHPDKGCEKKVGEKERSDFLSQITLFI